MKTSEIATLKTWITESNCIVFFGGCRRVHRVRHSGLSQRRRLISPEIRLPPETILSHSFFYSHTEEFYRFYREKMLPLEAEPNAAHLALATLEREGKLRAIVTQNIDGLHQKAGSRCVYELHGSVYRNRCTRCGKKYPPEFIRDSAGVPRCSCGGLIKPEVVLYEEGLDDACVEGAIRAISDADMLIVGGTSLTVYPAAGLIRYYGGSKLVLINRDETPYDSYANLIFRDPIGTVLSRSSDIPEGVSMNRKEFEIWTRNHIRLMDGATGSNLMKAGMPRGVCTESWVLSHPNALLSLQRAYQAAGSDMVYAPTFCANRIALASSSLEGEVCRMNRELVGAVETGGRKRHSRCRRHDNHRKACRPGGQRRLPASVRRLPGAGGGFDCRRCRPHRRGDHDGCKRMHRRHRSNPFARRYRSPLHTFGPVRRQMLL